MVRFSILVKNLPWLKNWIERHTRTSPDSVVLSLYSGTGTKATLAMKMGRSSVSVDFRESQVDGAYKRLCEMKLNLAAQKVIDDDGFLIKVKPVSNECTDSSSSAPMKQVQISEISGKDSEPKETTCHGCKKEVNDKQMLCIQCKNIFCDSIECVNFAKCGSENGPFYCSNACLSASGV